MKENNTINEGVVLSDDILENVSGGSIFSPVNVTCRHCGWTNVIQLGQDKYTCANCGEVTEIMG